MNKYAIIPLFTIVVCAAIVVGFFWLREDMSKTVVKPQPVKVVSDVAKSSQSMEFSQSGDALKPSSGIKNEQSDIYQSIEMSEEVVSEKVLSAVLGGITGQSAIDELSEAELLSTLFDRGASIKDRRRAAWALAKNGGADILPKLEEILSKEDTPPYLKAAILEGLGHSTQPQANELILAMLQDENDVVVRGAIKGLSATGNQEAILILSDILLFPKGRSDSIIAEAALGLGKIDNPDAYNMLVKAYHEASISENIDLQKNVISALGYRDIAESGAFFQSILDANPSNPSLRLAAVEAIQDAEGDTGSILSNYLNDTDSEVRAEAAWALAAADNPGNISEEIETYLAKEQDSEVRKRLYQALGNQENLDINFVNDIVYKEPDMDARVAGYDLLAQNISSSEDKNLITQFNETAIPELREIALSAENLHSRLSAVIALKKANSNQANLSLEEIEEKSTDMKVVEATGIIR